MENSIEFGCKFLAGTDDATVLPKLKELYGFNHLQVASSDFKSLETSLREVYAVVDKYELELSSIIKSSNYDIYRDYKTLFDVCKTYGVKYFVVELEEDIYSSEIALFELIKNIIEISANDHILACLKFKTQSKIDEHIRSLNDLTPVSAPTFFFYQLKRTH